MTELALLDIPRLRIAQHLRRNPASLALRLHRLAFWEELAISDEYEAAQQR